MPTATRDAKQRFATVFNFLASTKNTPVDAVKLSAYYKELAGVDIEALEATGGNHRHTCQTPAPGKPGQ